MPFHPEATKKQKGRGGKKKSDVGWIVSKIDGRVPLYCRLTSDCSSAETKRQTRSSQNTCVSSAALIFSIGGSDSLQFSRILCDSLCNSKRRGTGRGQLLFFFQNRWPACCRFFGILWDSLRFFEILWEKVRRLLRDRIGVIFGLFPVIRFRCF